MVTLRKLINNVKFYHSPLAVAMCSGKQTHSEGQCREWSAAYYTGGPKADSPVSQGLRPVFVKNLYTLSDVKSLSRVQLFVTPRTVAYQASQSMGFSRHDYWSRLPFPSPGVLPKPGIEPGSPTL